MTRKIIGTILLVASGMLGVILLNNGMLIFPHLIGPILLALIGAIMLTLKGKASHSTQ